MPETRTTTRTDAEALPIAGWAVALFLLTVLLYSPVGGFDFVHYDDDVFVFENGRVNGGLTADGVAWAFGRPDIDYWRPLTWISHMLDVEVFGLRAGGHHLVNVLWHAANAVLLFVLLFRTTGRRAAAWMVAALFAWHPLHVESVAWIAERKDVMCGFFWLLTLLLYARYTRSGRRRDYGMTLVSFALGLSCKPMIITLPFQLLLLDLWPLGRWGAGGVSGRGRGPVALMLEKVPFLVLALVGGIAVVLAQDAVGALKSTTDYSPAHRVGNALLAILGYLEKTVWPVDLICFYEHPAGFPTGRLLAAAGLVVGGSVFALLSVRRLPVLFSGWFWFLGTLIPVIGLVQVGDQAMADRYTYMALIGLFWIAVRAGEGVAAWRPWMKVVLWPAGGMLLCVCALGTWRQLPVWRNSESLFEHALSVDPRNRLALNNLAYLHFTRGQDLPAADLYRRFLEVDPGADRAHYNLAEILERSGKPAEAVGHWQRLTEMAPDFAVAWIGWVRASLAAGDAAGALKAAEGALMQMPEDPRLLLELTGMLRGGGPPEAVRKLCRDLLERRPRDFALHAQLLAEWRREDQEGEAVASTERLLTLFPDAAEAHYHAALTLAHFRRESDAERHLQSALRLNPGFATARLELARLLAVAADPAVHDPVMAGLIVDGAEKAMGMKLPQTLEVRAELAWRAGKRAQAVALMEAAVERAREMKLSEVESSLSIRLAGLRREQEQ